MLEIEISHTCQELEAEKQRLIETGFNPEITVEMGTTDEWEVMVILYDRMSDDNKLISINAIDVKCCPYCGMRLPSVGGSGHDQ